MFDPTGRRVTAVRSLTAAEMTSMDWDASTIRGMPFTIELDDGITIVGSSDPECNRHGHLIAFDAAFL
jgi:hypothetical protein